MIRVVGGTRCVCSGYWGLNGDRGSVLGTYVCIYLACVSSVVGGCVVQ